MMFRQIGENVTIREMAKFSRQENIVIGNHVMIDDFTFIAGGQGENLTVIGDHVHIAMFSSVQGIGGVTFGLGSGLSPGCRVFSSVDDYVNGGLMNPTFPEKYRNDKVGHVTFGRFVILGANCVVLAGITIGEGATIGAGSVVTKDLEPWTVNVGTPAKPIKFRKKDEVLSRWELYLQENTR